MKILFANIPFVVKKEGEKFLYLVRTRPEDIFNAQQGEQLIADKIIKDEDQHQRRGVAD